MFSIELQQLDTLAKLVGIVGGTASLIIGAHRVSKNTRINRAKLWLDFRRMIYEHDEVHLLLRPKGDWHASNEHPTDKEMPKVEPYMGLFEHAYEMLEDKLIDWETFRNVYGYRIDNIVVNQVINREKLVKRPEGWANFISLIKRLGYVRQGDQYVRPE